MKEFITKHITFIVSFGLVALLIALILFGFYGESFFLSILALSIWFIKLLLERNFKNIDKKIDQQNQLLLTKAKGGIGFQQYILENMYNVTNSLWEESLWIAYNWNALWPGHDDDTEMRNNFFEKLENYKWNLRVKSINIPSNVYKEFSKIIEGINKYEIGRDQRYGRLGGEVTPEESREGGAEMTAGSKLIAEAIAELFKCIRNEFGMDNLPSDLLDIKQPEDIENS